MDIKARQRNGIVILDLSGRIDADCANLIEAVAQCLRDGYTDILCNFEDVQMIDYMGISVVVIAYKEIVNNQGRLKFVNVPMHLLGVLAVSGMDKVIDICATEEFALNGFKEDKAIENIKKMQLRRRFKRLPVDLKIELKSSLAHAPVCLKVDILNLSAIGAFIFGCDKFRLGDEVLLTMKLPPAVEDRIRAAGTDQLDEWSERFADGKALAEIFDTEQRH